MKDIKIAPSILAADKQNIEKEIQLAVESGASFIHLDVMDGKFVPATTFDHSFVAKVSKLHHLVNDVHLMIEHPENVIEDYVKAGSDIITFHLEACKDNKQAQEIINRIHSFGIKAGISIKPVTSPEVLLPVLPSLDLILVMSVEPGKGGQSFMPAALEKIAFLRAELDKIGSKAYLEVDGGINENTGKLVKEAGADVLVAGTYLFGQKDFKERLAKLKE